MGNEASPGGEILNYVEIIPWVVGIIFGAGGLAVIQRSTSRDVNGLGRQYRRSLAAQVRILAAEISDAVLKEKFMHLADLIDPK